MVTNQPLAEICGVGFCFSTLAQPLLTLVLKHNSSAGARGKAQRMPQTNHTLLASGAPQLLRRAMTSMIVTTMVIIGAILTAPVDALALQTNPSVLSFTGTQGAADPSAQSVTLWKRNDRDNSWTANVSASWLTVSPTAGTISTERDQVSVDVNLSDLAAGNYSSNIIIIEVGPKGGTDRKSVV